MKNISMHATEIIEIISLVVKEYAEAFPFML